MDLDGNILVDALKEVVEAVKVELGIPNLNYQYGYIQELNETLLQWTQTNEYLAKKYPLVWLRQPFTIDRNVPAGYGVVENLTLFIINQTDANYKASERMEKNFKPVLYPIYNSLLEQINLSTSFQNEYIRPHKVTDRYYWGDGQQNEIADKVDCLEISGLKLGIEFKLNCIPFKNI